MTKEELKTAVCDMSHWRQIGVGARKGMWRYSGPAGTILLADMSQPPSLLNVEEFLKRLNLSQPTADTIEQKIRHEFEKAWLSQEITLRRVHFMASKEIHFSKRAAWLVFMELWKRLDKP